MGTCQSHTSDCTGVPVGSGTIHKPDNSVLGKQISKSSPSKRSGGTMLMFPSKHSKLPSLVSPSEKTNATTPETPFFQLASPNDGKFNFVSPMPLSVSVDLPKGPDESAVESPSFDSASSVSFDNRSMSRSVIESVITEGVPSEDDNRNPSTHIATDDISISSSQPVRSRKKKHQDPKDGHPAAIPLSMGVAVASPTHNTKAKKRAAEAARLHMVNSRVTTPESIVFRPAPLTAPRKGSNDDVPPTVVGPHKKPKTSVNPQTIADFNRLKVQVQLAEKNDLHLRRKAKLEDRFEDVKAYRSLWKDFESLKEKLDQTIPNSCCESNDKAGYAEKSMDLKDSASWFFDFQSLSSMKHLEGYGDDDAQSQSSLSLLSEITMEAQRKYYSKKRGERREKKQKSPKQSPTKDRKLMKSRSNFFDDGSITTAHSMTTRGSGAYIRGTTNVYSGDYGPMKEGGMSGRDVLCDIDSDDSTPRTRTGRTNADDMSRNTLHDEGNSVISDLDMDNDYNVPRRRRPHCHVSDESSLDTYHGNDKSLGESGFSKIELDMNGFQPRVRGKTEDRKNVSNLRSSHIADRKSSIETLSPVSNVVNKYWTRSISDSAKARIENYGFDPSAPLSSQLALFEQSVPSVEIADAKSGIVRWRNFRSNDKKAPATARRLERIFRSENMKGTNATFMAVGVATASGNADFVPSSNATDQNLPAKTQPSPGTTAPTYSPYDFMSPGHFLMMSSSHSAATYSDGDGEYSDVEKQEDTNMPDHSIDDNDDIKANEGMMRAAKDPSKQSDRLSLKKYDPVISSLSTEAFLRMSSWHVPAPAVEAIAQDQVGIDRYVETIPDSEVGPGDQSSSEASSSEHQSQKERGQGPSYATDGIGLESKRKHITVASEDISRQVNKEVDALVAKFRCDNNSYDGS